MRRAFAPYVHGWQRALRVFAVLCTCMTGCLLASAPALAEFSRPFLEEIKGTNVPPNPVFDGVGGLATDLASPEDWWVGDGNGLVDEFSSANRFIPPPQEGCPTNSLAYNDKNNKLYCSGEGEWVAVDNSTNSKDTAVGDVYFARSGVHAGEIGTVRREEAGGGSVPFTCLENDSRPGYINANGELIGGKGIDGEVEPWVNFIGHPPNGVAIDSSSGAFAGYIYVVDDNLAKETQVEQFTPEGCFVKAFSEAGLPLESFGSNELNGVAVDPTDGDVLITEDKNSEGEHAVIDEFAPRAGGEYLGQITGTSRTAPFERSPFRGGIAVSAKGNLYVGIDEVGMHVVDEFGPGAFYPGAVTGEVTDDQPETAVLNGVVSGVVRKEESGGRIVQTALKLTGCEFEYVTEAVFQKSKSEGKGGFSAVEPGERAQCVPTLTGQRLEAHNYEVHAKATHLKSGEIYDYRLVATTDPSERGGTSDGDVESFAAAAKPVVEDVSVDDVSSSWADFHGVVDPMGEDTSYHFEYMTAAAFAADGDSFVGADPAASAPGTAADIGSGDKGVSVNVQAGGLAASTTYEYRLVASNGEGATDSGSGVFSTSPAMVAGLPDGRAYEMLTPSNKEDSEDMFGGPEDLGGNTRTEEGLGGATNYDLGYSSEDGDHFLLFTTAAFGPFPSSGEGTYVFSRGADGWSAEASASPLLGVQSGFDAVYDPLDFSVVGFHDDLVGRGSKLSANLVGPAGGPYATLQSGEEGDEGAAASTNAEMVGASADLSRVVLESADHGLASSEQERKLDSKQYPGSQALYEWGAAEGLRLVNLNPKGELFKCGAILGESGDQTDPVGGTHGAVSADGSEVFFTAPDPYEENVGSGCWNGGVESSPQLYMREDGKTTVEISAPEKGVFDSSCAHREEACHPAIFVGASKDGSKVFFLTQTELTKEAEELGLHDVELYEYDTEVPEGERLTRVSAGEEGAPGRASGAAVVNVPAVSSDGSAVYFTATGKRLTSTAPEGGGLYRYDTVTHKTTYVAPSGGYPALHEPQHAWYASILGLRSVAGLSVSANYYATGDGQFLIFPSSQNITGYDPGGRPELYRYHYEPESVSGGSIVCVSCNPNGSPPSYGSTFTRSALTGDDPAGGTPRSISENGQYVFFDTQESLLPADTNGKVDVYEWHEDPVSHDGTISLITTGQDTSDSFFLDSSPDGRNVFFGTHSQLVPADQDNQGDLYDARIEGGFPAPLGPGPCEGDACDNPPPAPSDPTPTLLPSVGGGNLLGVVPPPVVKKSAVKCAKPKKLKKGKCVKPRPKKKAKQADDDRRAQ